LSISLRQPSYIIRKDGIYYSAVACPPACAEAEKSPSPSVLGTSGKLSFCRRRSPLRLMALWRGQGLR